VWGEGALFAFSGVDGPTDVASGFVATLGARPLDLLFHTPCQWRLRVRPSDGDIEIVLLTSDVALGRVGAEACRLVWTAWHTLAGAGPVSLEVALEGLNGRRLPAAAEAVVDADGGRAALALVRPGERWALSYGHSVAEARARAQGGLGADLQAETDARLAWRERVAHLADPRRDRFLRKCLGVMKVNALAPEGANRRLWSTPDRVPHRHMWLWDSVFHSLAMNLVDPAAAWSFLAAVLDRQRADGMVPHMMPAHEPCSAITQPPLLAWGVWENYQRTGDRDALRWALPRLEAYLDWNLEHRDRNGNGLLEWHVQGDPRCRSGESGMDNSPRFDRGEALDAVDFSSFQAQDMECVAAIAAVLGAAATAARWRQRAEASRRRLFGTLWRDGFYYDCDLEGRPTGVKAVSGFLPLLLPGVPADHVAALVRQLDNPATFAAPFPVPSVSLDDPAFSTDMWRGPTWANLNYAVILGLRRQGQRTVADRLAALTLEHVARHFEASGVLFEFFDARDEVPPQACARKGPCAGQYDLRRKVDSIRDYHWTAAVAACLLLES